MITLVPLPLDVFVNKVVMLDVELSPLAVYVTEPR